MTMSLPFVKMHGAGNDFVIFDARKTPLSLTAAQLRRIANRENGVTQGCDQVIVMEPSGKADVFMRIFNADGSEVNACGNATRCVGWLMLEEKKTSGVSVQTNADILYCAQNTLGAAIPEWRDASGLVAADMGVPKSGWQDIPLSQAVDTLHVPLEIEGVSDPVCVSMGNPHVVFFVQDAALLDRIASIGAQLQTHTLFPKGVNVSIAYVASPDSILMRVWERGVGLTESCGTAACAVEVAAVRRGLVAAGRQHTLTLRNGAHIQSLMVWEQDGHVFLHGPVKREFSGEWAA